jgi:mono/diheme cytochrome c family protein
MITKTVKATNYFIRVALVAFVLGLSSFMSFAQSAPDPALVEKGKELFNNNCQSCHAVTDEVVVGPGLKGIDQRRNEAWLGKWIRNSTAVIASGDSYAVALFNKFGKTPMTSFPSLSDDDIKGILAYVKSAEAPVVVAGPTPSGGTTNAEGNSSSLFNYLLVGVLAMMSLVLLALLSMVKTLGNVVKGEAGVDTTSEATFSQRFSAALETLSNNSAFRTSALLFFLLVAGKATIDGLFGIGMHQGYAPEQPIKFSHKLHAGSYKINCNYCHTGVYKGKGANIPSSSICMNCHNTIKRESPEIQKIYKAIEQDKPVEWVRVHNLPDLAYFNHSQHVNVGGLECKQCHGDVENMEVIQQRSSLTMGWCIDCHRKTNVNHAGNAYYDKLVELHKKDGNKDLKVANLGGLECGKCHY